MSAARLRMRRTTRMVRVERVCVCVFRKLERLTEKDSAAPKTGEPKAKREKTEKPVVYWLYGVSYGSSFRLR